MRISRLAAVFGSALILTACGANGILGLNPKPDGNIVISNPTSGVALQTSFAAPYIVTSGGFSIGITENYFTGPYNVSVIAWTAPFSIPCFVPHYVDQASKTNVVRFTADNAAPLTNLAQPSPCGQFTLNGVKQFTEETVHITDNDGHVANFYYSLE